MSGKKIKTIDLMVDLISYISEILEKKPLSQPGLFRKLNLEYFDRIESIEYTVSNDDGLSPQTLQDADIVITGVSRTGKTPLSMYLAMFGWKVANIPLIKDIPPPEELFKLDHKRVIGLNINMNQLLSHRRKRLQSFGNVGDSDYINPATIRQELDYAFSIFQQGYFSVINVTGKPIESIANEIIKLITQRFKAGSRKSK